MKTIESLKPTLSKFPAEFARGRAARQALAPFASPDDVLAALAQSACTSRQARDAITLALVAEHQERGGPLWQSILLVAYEPMLAGVWGRLRDRKDAESRLVVGFLEAIGKLSLDPPPALVALDLRRATERAVFGPPSKWHADPETVSLGAVRSEPAPERLEAEVERREQMHKIASELESLFGDPATARETLEVLLHARTGTEPLERFVAERHSRHGAQRRASVYARLQKQRARALAHLTSRFGGDLETALAAA
jgi:hypothetical protein